MVLISKHPAVFLMCPLPINNTNDFPTPQGVNDKYRHVLLNKKLTYHVS